MVKSRRNQVLSDGMSIEEQTRTLAAELREWRSTGASSFTSVPAAPPPSAADQAELRVASAARANGGTACISCERHREEERALREELSRVRAEAEAAGGERDELRGRLAEYQAWEQEQDAWVEEEVHAPPALPQSLGLTSLASPGAFPMQS